jgi:hypothetical protein
MNRTFANPVYEQLQRQLHRALLVQHPEWILPDGTCPTGDAYEARFLKLLMQLPQRKRATAAYGDGVHSIKKTADTL